MLRIIGKYYSNIINVNISSYVKCINTTSYLLEIITHKNNINKNNINNRTILHFDINCDGNNFTNENYNNNLKNNLKNTHVKNIHVKGFNALNNDTIYNCNIDSNINKHPMKYSFDGITNINVVSC